MWTKFLDSQWSKNLFSASIAIIAVFVGQWLISGRESRYSIKAEFDKRPTTEQIDYKLVEVKSYVDSRANNIEKTLQQHIEESSRSDENVMKYIISIDGKINILLNQK